MRWEIHFIKRTSLGVCVCVCVGRSDLFLENRKCLLKKKSLHIFCTCVCIYCWYISSCRCCVVCWRDVNLICISIASGESAYIHIVISKSCSVYLHVYTEISPSLSLSSSPFVTLDMHFVKLLGRMGAFPPLNVSWPESWQKLPRKKIRK